MVTVCPILKSTIEHASSTCGDCGSHWLLREHLAADVKRLTEDEETGAKSYKYVKTGTNHFSLAFTYDCIAWSKEPKGGDYSYAAIWRGEPFWDPILNMDSAPPGCRSRRPPAWDERKFDPIMDVKF